MKMLLNARPFSPSDAAETWAHLLETLDAEAPKTGRIVTAIRFNGVDEPAFRAANVLARRLDEYDTVEVDTATPRALVLRTLTEGAAMTSSLSDAVEAIAEAFREPDVSDAQTMLPQLVDGIRHIVTLTDACSVALGIGLHTLTCQGTPFDRWMEEFGRRLVAVLECEGQKDWSTLADRLEFEIGPALREWSSIFEQLTTTAHNSAA